MRFKKKYLGLALVTYLYYRLVFRRKEFNHEREENA